MGGGAKGNFFSTHVRQPTGSYYFSCRFYLLVHHCQVLCVRWHVLLLLPVVIWNVFLAAAAGTLMAF